MSDNSLQLLYPKEAKDRALELYLRDETVTRIAKIIAHEFNRPTAASTIHNWIKNYDWKLIKMTAKEKALNQQESDAVTDLASKSKEQQDAYHNIWKKAGTELADLTFDNPLDAVKAMEIGMKGERAITEGFIQASFINQIRIILMEEIEDDRVLGRIALRLKQLLLGERVGD